jgi:hypothetical protein
VLHRVAIGLSVIILAVLTTIMFAPTLPAIAAEPGPVFVAPVDGATLVYNDDLAFRARPVTDSQGYLWGFFQNGSMVWENYRDEGRLSGADYTIHLNTRGHSAVAAGPLQVWVRAMVNNQWTDATIINVTTLVAPVPVPVPTPTGPPPAPILTPEQQQQLRDLLAKANNERKAVSCGIYFGKALYEGVLWLNQIALAAGKGGLSLPPPSGQSPVYTGQCHFINWQELSALKLMKWPMSDPLLGTPQP